jgi:hypothetical protein
MWCCRKQDGCQDRCHEVHRCGVVVCVLCVLFRVWSIVVISIRVQSCDSRFRYCTPRRTRIDEVAQAPTPALHSRNLLPAILVS